MHKAVSEQGEWQCCNLVGNPGCSCSLSSHPKNIHCYLDQKHVVTYQIIFSLIYLFSLIFLTWLNPISNLGCLNILRWFIKTAVPLSSYVGWNWMEIQIWPFSEFCRWSWANSLTWSCCFCAKKSVSYRGMRGYRCLAHRQ